MENRSNRNDWRHVLSLIKVTKSDVTEAQGNRGRHIILCINIYNRGWNTFYTKRTIIEVQIVMKLIIISNDQ